MTISFVCLVPVRLLLSSKAVLYHNLLHKGLFRPCLHGGGGPQVGEVTSLGGVTRLSIWSLILIWSRLHDRWGDPPRRVARSTRPGYPLSRGQILPCKRSRCGNPPSRGLIRDTSNSRKIHFGGGFASLLKETIESHSTEGCSKSSKGVFKSIFAKTRGLPAYFLFTCLATIQ